jgi:hypothetical protein
VQKESTVWLTRGYQWLAQEKLDTFTARADALYQAGGRGEDLIALLREMVKPALWTHKNASISVDLDGARVTVFLPASGVKRIKAVLAELRAPTTRPPLPLAPADRKREKALLATPVALPRGPLDAAASLDAAAQSAGLSIGYRLQDLAGHAGGFTWDDPQLTLGRVLARVLVRTPLSGYLIEQQQAIWLYKGQPPLPSQQDLWQTAGVVAIDLRPLASKRKIGAAMLLHMIKHNVAPGTWRDPATGLAVHRLTGRLVVVHHPDVIRTVSAYLLRLEQTDDETLWGIEKNDE